MNKILNKVSIIIILIIAFTINLKSASAATANISLYASSKTVYVNDTITISVTVSESDGKLGSWNYEISHDSSKLSLISGSEGQYGEVGDGSITSKTYTLKYKAIALGSSTISVNYADIRDWDSEQSISVNKGSITINVVNRSSSNNSSSVTKSSDNNLKSLSIDNTTLSPEFNKDNLEYSVELESDITKIKVNAETNDSKASVSGIGEIDVKEGQNKIEVVVTAENGSTKTYIINAYVKEKDPIKVKSSGNNYTVVRNLDGITIPDNFEEVDVRIDDETVKGFYNKVSNITLVALKDKKGNISLFIYDLNKFTYTKYNSITSSNANIIVIKPDKNIKIPHKYYEVNFEYNGETIKGYTLGENSQFRIIYGIDSQTGEKTFYQYDLVNNTIQRFYNEQVEIYVNLIKKCKFVFLILGISIIVLIIIIIILLSRNIKFKNNYLNSELISNPRKNNKSQNDSDVELKDSNKRKKEKTFLDE